MITYIEGKLTEKTPTYAVIECSGIGYLLHISLHTFSLIASEGSCKLFTHLAIREDAHTLYGFAEQEERHLFRHLISVSGVGANTARMILSSLSPSEIHQAILSGNVSLLQSVKGIGAKSAQRIIVDLKDRLEKEGLISEVSFPLNNRIKDEALSALVMLGFAKSVAEKAVDKVIKSEGSNLLVEQLIKSALKNL